MDNRCHNRSVRVRAAQDAAYQSGDHFSVTYVSPGSFPYFCSIYPAMKGLIEEGSEILKEDCEDSVFDAGIIVAAQKVEHYEIASYGSVRTFANLLNQDEPARLLQSTLDEESETNEILNGLAESIVNPEAVNETELAGAGSNR